MSGQFSWDYDDFPLVVLRYVGTISDASFDEYLRTYRALLDRNQPYAIILDAALAGAPNAAQRRAQAKFLEDNAPLTRRLCRGGAFVITSPMIRGALTAILWISEMPFESTVVGDIFTAARWTCGRLEMPVPKRFASNAQAR